MAILRQAALFAAFLLILIAAMLGGFYVLGPLLEGPDSSSRVSDGSQDRAASRTDLDSGEEPSPTPYPTVRPKPSAGPTLEPTPPPLPTLTPTLVPLPTVGPTRSPLSSPMPTLPPASAATPTQTQIAGGSAEPAAVPTEATVPAEVTVTAAVEEVAGIVVAPLDLFVGESGGSATFSITLQSEPSVAVTIPLRVSGGECEVTPDEVLLDRDNWQSGAWVTVLAVDDELVDGDQICVVETGVAVSSAANYSEMAVEDVMVTVEDDDAAGIVVAPMSLGVSEPEGSAIFTIGLASEPVAAVTIPLSTSSDECRVVPGEVSLDSSNWRNGVSVVVEAVDDTVEDGDQECVVETGTASSTGTDYGGMAAGNVSVTVADDDIAGIVVTPTSLEVGESENPGALTLALSSEPLTEVTISLSVSGEACTVKPDAVTLDRGNWRAGVGVTVAGVDDKVDDGDRVCVVEMGAASSKAADYRDMTVKDVTITVVEDDAAGIVVAPTSLAVIESGGSGTFAITLNSEPAAEVRIPLSVSSDECRVAPGAVTLDGGNWQSGVTVTVEGVDDGLEDGDQTCMVETGAASSEGVDYGDMAVEDVSVTVEDDDAAAVVVAPLSLAVSEPAGSEVFTITLGSEPLAEVRIPLGVSSGQCRVAPDAVTLDGGNWRGGVTVTAVAVDDEVRDGDQICVVETGAAESSGADYHDMVLEDVTVTVVDDETAGVVVSPASLTVGEAGDSDTFTIALSSEPVAAVTVPLTVSSDECTVAPAEVTLDGGNWRDGMDVTVAAVDDEVDDGDGACVVETGVASSSGTDYGGLAVEDVAVTVTDDDTAGAVVAPTSLELNEPEGSGSFAITLTSQPIAKVVFDISVDAQTTVSPTQLTFTDLNWNVQQPVAVTVVDDNVAEGQHSSIIHPVASSDDGQYASDALGSVTVIISDDETAALVVTPPQIRVAEGGKPQSYEVVLASQPTDTVTVSLTTDGQTIVTPTLLTFAELEWNVPRVLTVTAVDDEDPEGLHTSAISYSGNSGDGSYHGNPMGVVSSRVTDNDKETWGSTGRAELAALTDRLSDTVGGITKGDIRLSPPLVLVILLVVVASAVELVSARRRR